MANYAKVKKSGREASWVRVLKTLNSAESPLSMKDLLVLSGTKNGNAIRDLRKDNLIFRQKIGPHNKMGYSLSYKGLKQLNIAEKTLNKAK